MFTHHEAFLASVIKFYCNDYGVLTELEVEAPLSGDIAGINDRQRRYYAIIYYSSKSIDCYWLIMVNNSSTIILKEWQQFDE